MDAPLRQLSDSIIDVTTIPISYRNRTFFRLKNIVLLENYLKYKKFIPKTARDVLGIRNQADACVLQKQGKMKIQWIFLRGRGNSDELSVFSCIVRSRCGDFNRWRDAVARYVFIRTDHRLGRRAVVVVCGNRLFREAAKEQMIQKRD